VTTLQSLRRQSIKPDVTEHPELAQRWRGAAADAVPPDVTRRP
jgi:hypothetical protein